jgi:hypothetical protein
MTVLLICQIFVYCIVIVQIANKVGNLKKMLLWSMTIDRVWICNWIY